jgi:hypothetical protein
MSNANGLATAADFRQMAEASSWGPPERLPLPKSGRTVLIRRPTKHYWALRRAGWPPQLRDKMQAIAEGAKLKLDREESLRLVKEDHEMRVLAFVQPPVCLTPGDDLFVPEFLPDEDAEVVDAFLRGQVLANGQDLEGFPRGEPGPPADSGATGPDLALPSEPASKPVGS